MKLFENKEKKYIISKNYNCILDKKTNSFLRCGNTINEVPLSGALEYLDVELTNIYTNIEKYNFLFKNKPLNKKKYMKFNTFRKIINILPKTINHVNFLLDPECKTNPDIWKILYYCKINNITTSITVDNVNKKIAKKISSLCENVSVNIHEDKNLCYNTIDNFSKYNIKPNLNILVSKETHHIILRTINDYYIDKRLKNINHINFIGLKQIANWRFLNNIGIDNFKRIISLMIKLNIQFNLDSYLIPYFIKESKNNLNFYSNIIMSQCESLTFNAYIDVYNYVFPCKYYIPNEKFFIGFNIFEPKKFEDAWFSRLFQDIRKKILVKNKIRKCLFY